MNENKPYAFAYERTDLPEEMREFYGPAIHMKQIEAFPENWMEIQLYEHSAPPSELVKAAEDFIDYFNPGADADRSGEQIIAFLKDYEERLRSALTKVKP